jgi:hypothetical protein
LEGVINTHEHSKLTLVKEVSTALGKKIRLLEKYTMSGSLGAIDFIEDLEDGVGTTTQIMLKMENLNLFTTCN